MSARKAVGEVAVFAFCALLVGTIGYKLGKTEGVAEGRQQASDEIFDANVCEEPAHGH